jgi:tetratricopeptide (TPR) repeat protein
MITYAKLFIKPAGLGIYTMNARAIEISNRGSAQKALGNRAEAIADYTQALALYPENEKLYRAHCYLNRGNAQQALGNHAEAIADSNLALALYPENEKLHRADCYSNRGNAQQAFGNHAEAIADSNLALALYPENEKLYRADCYLNRGNAQQALGNHAEAIADSNLALALYPENEKLYRADCYLNRGNAQKNFGNHAEAIADYTSAIRLDPKIAENFNVEQLKDLFKNHPGFYDETLKRVLSNRQRVSACYNGEVDSLLTDDHGRSLYINKPVILTCCGNTFDLETLQKWAAKTCPCCRVPYTKEYLRNPIVNILVQKILEKDVAEKEAVARAQQLEELAKTSQLVMNANVAINQSEEGQPSLEPQQASIPDQNQSLPQPATS